MNDDMAFFAMEICKVIAEIFFENEGLNGRKFLKVEDLARSKFPQTRQNCSFFSSETMIGKIPFHVRFIITVQCTGN